MKLSPRLKQKLSKVRLVLTDVDGVLCTRDLWLAGGQDIKRFSALDGIGKYKLDKLGIVVGIITGRESETVRVRACELGIELVHIATASKVREYDMIMADGTWTADEVCYIGDDEPDTELFTEVGLAVAPADTSITVRSYADYVTIAKGGGGVLREVADLIVAVQAQCA